MTQATSSLLVPATEVLAPEDLPEIDHLVTEDDTPVDNIFCERQQHLLIEALYRSWAGPGEGRPFLALANVGLFYSVYQPPLVPDVLLSLDVRPPADIFVKRHRSYFTWEYGKPPDVVIEIVSNLKGAEAESKLRDYARIGVDYYVIFDPEEQLGAGPLRVYRNSGGIYRLLEEGKFPEVGLGVTLWKGIYDDVEQTWLRWCDLEGRLILTGAERAEQADQRAEQADQRAEQERQKAEQERQKAEQERQKAEQERQRADQADQRADQERQRAERLAAQLRALGVEPDENV